MNRIRSSAYLLLGSYILMALLLFIWPFQLDGYSWKQHSIAEMAAQNTPFSWIFNGLWVGLGIGIVWAGRNLMYGYWFQRILLSIFGLSLIFSAFFSAAPINPDLTYNLKEAELHFIFKTLSQGAFIVLAMAISFVLKDKKDKILGWIIVTIATVFTLLLFTLSSYPGILQHLLFLGSFGWLIYLFGFSEEQT